MKWELHAEAHCINKSLGPGPVCFVWQQKVSKCLFEVFIENHRLQHMIDPGDAATKYLIDKGLDGISVQPFLGFFLVGTVQVQLQVTSACIPH